VNVVSGSSPLGALIAIVLSWLSGLAGPSAAPTRPRPLPPKRDHATAATAAPSVRSRGPFAVGIRTITFVDPSRKVRFPGHKPAPRELVTVIRYPAIGAATATDVPGAPPARGAGPFPLVIFGHGFAVTPRPYARLLEAWARAGYVVAAPIFPLGNANAPGGPNESDIVNQPRDMSFVISRLVTLSAARRGLFSRLIDSREIAVSGQSDGGETALAAAYDRYYLDRRVRAAVILSGAEIPGVGGFTFPAPSPPLLATQGTADTVNRPSFTYAFFGIAPRPKFLLTLIGASHLSPYTGQQPQLAIVERVTIAFLNRYLKDERSQLTAMVRAGNVRGVAALQADP
jgi:predicted dienelactone hydrolase